MIEQERAIILAPIQFAFTVSFHFLFPLFNRTERQTTGLVLRHLDSERRSIGDRGRCHSLGITLRGCKGRDTR